MTVLRITRLLAYGLMVVCSGVLLFYLLTYVRSTLARTYRHGWTLIHLGVVAGGLYGLFGGLGELGWLESSRALTAGASLFMVLFLALGIRSIYHLGDQGESPSKGSLWGDYGIVALFVFAWWTGYFASPGTGLYGVTALGWIGASVWALLYGVLAVARHEGTSLAALVRHLLPALICFAVVTGFDVLSRFIAGVRPVSQAIWIVGMVLVACFFFNTAVNLRQQEAELDRIYDRTTWEDDE